MARAPSEVSWVTPEPLDFFGLHPQEAEKRIGEICGRRFHGESFIRFVYKFLISDIEQMTSLSKENRQRLAQYVDISPLPVRKRLESNDGTVKFLFEVQTAKGPQEVEAVYIPEDGRVTLCVSSQVGCKMACAFCLTAQLGFKSHLTTSDIVRQIWTVNLDPKLRPISNIVFMGMGEPLDNKEAVRGACEILTHPKTFDLSAKKITVSTVGLVEHIDEIQKSDPFRLAVSLNGTTDEVRSSLMPVNRRWNIERLLKSCGDYARRTNKRVTFEYILMKGLTDRDEDAKRLISLLSPIPCKVNLIPYNESPYTEFKRPDEEKIQAFHKKLLQAKFAVFIRKNRGNDIFAACGMLKKLDPNQIAQ